MLGSSDTYWVISCTLSSGLSWNLTITAKSVTGGSREMIICTNWQKTVRFSPRRRSQPTSTCRRKLELGDREAIYFKILIIIQLYFAFRPKIFTHSFFVLSNQQFLQSTVFAALTDIIVFIQSTPPPSSASRTLQRYRLSPMSFDK